MRSDRLSRAPRGLVGGGRLRAILQRPTSVFGADAFPFARPLGTPTTVGLGRAGVDPPCLGHDAGDEIAGVHRRFRRPLGHLREEIDELLAQSPQLLALLLAAAGQHAADVAEIRLRRAAELVDRVGIPGLAAGAAAKEERGVIELQRRRSLFFGGRSSAQRSE